MEKTRIGAAVRATVDDAEMARGVGIDTSRISMFIFALGALLAALGGVIGGAFLGVYPGLDFQILPVAFAVVIIGGMGSLGGAAIGALIVGLADNFGKALFPEVSYFTLYAPMVLLLAVKPTFITEAEAQFIVDVYREENPEIPELWKELEHAAFEAVSSRSGLVTSAGHGRVHFARQGTWLYTRLPSSGALPRLKCSRKLRCCLI
jgi:hypothetical protein